MNRLLHTYSCCTILSGSTGNLCCIRCKCNLINDNDNFSYQQDFPDRHSCRGGRPGRRSSLRAHVGCPTGRCDDRLGLRGRGNERQGATWSGRWSGRYERYRRHLGVLLLGRRCLTRRLPGRSSSRRRASPPDHQPSRRRRGARRRNHATPLALRILAAQRSSVIADYCIRRDAAKPGIADSRSDEGSRYRVRGHGERHRDHTATGFSGAYGEDGHGAMRVPAWLGGPVLPRVGNTPDAVTVSAAGVFVSAVGGTQAAGTPGSAIPAGAPVAADSCGAVIWEEPHGRSI